MESASIVSHRFIADQHLGIVPCRVAHVDLGLDTVDPGLAPNGAKCGHNKVRRRVNVVEKGSLGFSVLG